VIPYPILLVLVGLAIGAMPGLPAVKLDPDLVFLVFLPPILFAAAYFTSFRDFRFKPPPDPDPRRRLVLATTSAVAAVPTRWCRPRLGARDRARRDRLAARRRGGDPVLGRLGVPRRVVTVLEGESLVTTRRRSCSTARPSSPRDGRVRAARDLLQFVLATALGIGVGIAVAYATRVALQLTHDSFVEIAITLLAPYVAWVLAERIHASGVLACVAGGLIVRRHMSAIVSPATRVQARASGSRAVPAERMIFILIGLQLATLRADLAPGGRSRSGSWPRRSSRRSSSCARSGCRSSPGSRASSRPRCGARPMPPRPAVALIAWVAMRGIVSLAAALACRS